MRGRIIVALCTLPIFLCGWGSLSHSNITPPVGSSSWLNSEVRVLHAAAKNLNPKALKTGLKAYLKARTRGIDHKGILTIIDYSKPSTQRRLWVLDLTHEKVLFNTWVSHGKNSGRVNSTDFSNKNGTKKSSIGVFTTGKTYIGGRGYSLHLNGLEKGINDNAYKRNIVIHGAWYATGEVARKYGQLGRSWGCPAVSNVLARPIINTIKNDTLVLAWYPDSNWLNHSDWVTG